ncbi:LTA synthase family protein [Salipaludibacillus aurantiacus]|uniref:Phosphoglycerol transferase MdoB n=1 Tax=Salipaludibacillus aurantiacus TaxID=1601833 RepID=A0A1H9TH30_9BACI|nr:alkaline phosphatase family protein [Salipaludibacillus aurantiacus]SER96428.1 Phosphoglycerol transferase MdoB [Salipaludibacillus aurantiacus]
MVSKGKAYSLLFLFISVLINESIFRIASEGSLSITGLSISFLFSLSIALGIFTLASLFNARINYVIFSGFLVLTGLLFSSQLIYFKFFKTFYSLYSTGNVLQVAEFWRDIIELGLGNFAWIALFFSPAVFLFLYGKKLMTFHKLKGGLMTVLGCSFIISYFSAISVIYINGQDTNSPYELYFKQGGIVRSVDQLGLLTAMRLDLQRLVSDYPSGLAVKVPGELPAREEGEGEGLKEDELQMLDIDFETLIAEEEDEHIKQMHRYFHNVPPSRKNEFTGRFEGYNLVLITAEGFSPYAVHKEVTPTLYKMVNEGYKFTNFYNPLWEVSTSDGEYVATTGLLPMNGVWSFYKSGSNLMPFAMGNQLKKRGYKTVAYHNHTYSYYRRDVSHPNMGYSYKGIGNGLEVEEIWPASDLEMMQKTVPEYIKTQPFHAYYMTVSGHMQYNFSGNNQANKNRHYVEHLPFSEQAKAYLATQVELDHALDYLLSRLKEEGIAEQTLIVLSADHYPYGLEKKTIEELAGEPVERNFELYKSPLIMYTDGMEPVTVDKPASSLDIIPTLSNLMGLEFDSRLMIGRDIFSNSDPLVIFSNKSFITDKGRFNSETNTFTPVPGADVSEGYAEKISAEITNKFNVSANILELDYYNKVISD